MPEDMHANPDYCETAKVIIFALKQREYVDSFRAWRRRLAGFGYTIDQDESGAVLSIMPGRKKVCALPPEMCA